MPGVFLRICEDKGSLEERMSWTSSTSLPDQAKSLVAAFWIRAPIQAAPRLFTQSYLTRPQGQLGLACLLGVWRQSSPSPAHPLPLIFLPPSPLFPCFMAGIWKPFLFIHSTRMLLLAVLQRAESSDSPQGHFRGCMRSSQLFAGSAWAVTSVLEAARPSVHTGHPGLSESQGWRRCVFCPSLGGCFLAYCFPVSLSVL